MDFDDPMHTEAALREAVEQAYRRGAQMCREMQARFAEQGADDTTAQSIRANWNAAWGDDPGTWTRHFSPASMQTAFTGHPSAKKKPLQP